MALVVAISQAANLKTQFSRIYGMRLCDILFFLALPSAIFSQTAPESGLSSSKTENYVILNYDNDFFSGTDRYYTQGILLTLIHPVVRHSPFSYALIRLNKKALNYYGLHFEQDVFTPISIRHEGIFCGERPYAAVFFISHSLTSINSQKHLLIRSRLDLGVIGPSAKGEEEQKAIHKALVNIQPLGWQYQISNDAIINYDTKMEKGFWNKKYAELMGSGTLRLGTLYTDIAAGLFARLGIFSPYFNNLGLENDPSKRKNNFKIYVTGRINERLVGYNASLQGGLINTSSTYILPAGEVSRFVFDCQGGIVIAYKRMSLEYSKAYITREFKSGVDHGWGKCVVTVCF